MAETDADTEGDGGDPLLVAGTRVEVRNAFDRSWSRGFVVAEVTDGGYRLRRRSDGVEVPVVFTVDDVRRERKRSTWWV